MIRFCKTRTYDRAADFEGSQPSRIREKRERWEKNVTDAKDYFIA